MTAHDLKIWLVTNSYTQKQLASALRVTDKTVNTWANGAPPNWLQYALDGLLNANTLCKSAIVENNKLLNKGSK